MKRIFITLVGFASIYGFGQVGVETNTPQETLDVNGTLRISQMPLSGTDNALYNGNPTKNTRFVATKNVVADDNGNLGTVDMPNGGGGANGANGGYGDISTTIVTNSKQSVFSPKQLTANTLKEIPNSDVYVTVPQGATGATKNQVIVNWISTYIRVRSNNTIPNSNDNDHPNNANLNFRLHGKIYNVATGEVEETQLLTEEYFYQGAHRGVFTKTVPAMYIKTDLKPGKYKFVLCVGKSQGNNDWNIWSTSNANNDGKQFYLRNSFISGEAKLFIK